MDCLVSHHYCYLMRSPFPIVLGAILLSVNGCWSTLLNAMDQPEMVPPAPGPFIWAWEAWNLLPSQMRCFSHKHEACTLCQPIDFLRAGFKDLMIIGPGRAWGSWERQAWSPLNPTPGCFQFLLFLHWYVLYIQYVYEKTEIKFKTVKMFHLMLK